MIAEPVDAVAEAASASQLLTAAWPAPALHYTPEYVAWQFQFPSAEQPPVAVALRPGGEWAGFAGATPRRIRLQGRVQDVAVVSFVAVHPAWQGRGAGAALYAALLGELRRRECAVITFGQRGTAGQRLIERGYPAAGYRLEKMGEYAVFGCMPRPESPGPGAGWQAADFPVAELKPVGADWAWSAATEAQQQHYQRDPRPRRWLAVQRDGRRAAAWAVEVAFRTKQEISQVMTLESLWTEPDSPGAVSALARATGASTVIASNGAHLGATALRAEGFRQTPTLFDGYWARPEGSDWGPAAGTNLEVI